MNNAGVVIFNQENLSIEALPEAHQMTRHLIHLSSMIVIMKLDPKSTVYDVG